MSTKNSTTRVNKGHLWHTKYCNKIGGLGKCWTGASPPCGMLCPSTCSCSPHLHTRWNLRANCELCASQYWTLCIIVPCSSLGGNYIDDFILPSYLLNFLTKHKSFVSWGVDRSEHNSWYNPNTLKIFLWFGIPMRGVSGDGNEWINTWSNCCLWGEWVETARSMRRRGYRSLNERFVASIGAIYWPDGP